jgi:hypothetical protein
MIDLPTGPGEFIREPDETEWRPLIPAAEPAPEPTAPAPTPEDSTDGLQRPDSVRESGSDERDAGDPGGG